MTVSALTIPEPLPDDPDAVTTALETAAIFGTQGDTREAVRWVRRAAELAGDEGNDLRALTLARVAADLTNELGGDSTMPANTSRDAVPARVVAESITAATAPGGDSAMLDSARGLSPSLDAVAPAPDTSERASDIGLAPTVSAQPPANLGTPVPVAPDWIPPVPPPPNNVVTASGEPTGDELPVAPPPVTPPALLTPPEALAGPGPSPALPSQSPAAAIGPSQPPAQSLREALQRFSQHASHTSSSPPAAPALDQPDPQRSPALAALVQSIVQQTPRAQPAPGPGASASNGPSSSRSRPVSAASAAVSAAETRAALADTAPNFRVPEPDVENTQPGFVVQPAPSSDSFSDAITNPYAVPAVGAKPESATPPSRPTTVLVETPPAIREPATLEAPAVSTPKTRAGARQAVRVSIAATTEAGIFLVELLRNGANPAPGSHEAFVVLADPASDVFDD
jgi:hypothetical protein